MEAVLKESKNKNPNEVTVDILQPQGHPEVWPQLMAKLETCKKKAVQCGGLKSKQEGFIVLCLPWKISKAFKKEPEGAQQPFRNDSCLCIQRRWSCCGRCLGGMW